MSRCINKWIGIGYVGEDPFLRSTPAGISVSRLRLATSEKWKDKNSSEMKEETQWHSISLYGRLAEIAVEYCRKGDKVYIEGSIRNSSYVDKNTNEKKYVSEIKAREMILLGSRNNDGHAHIEKEISDIEKELDEDLPF